MKIVVNETCNKLHQSVARQFLLKVAKIENNFSGTLNINDWVSSFTLYGLGDAGAIIFRIKWTNGYAKQEEANNMPYLLFDERIGIMNTNEKDLEEEGVRYILTSVQEAIDKYNNEMILKASIGGNQS